MYPGNENSVGAAIMKSIFTFCYAGFSGYFKVKLLFLRVFHGL